MSSIDATPSRRFTRRDGVAQQLPFGLLPERLFVGLADGAIPCFQHTQQSVSHGSHAVHALPC